MVTGLLVLRGADQGAVVGPAAPVVVAGRQLVQRAEAFDFGFPYEYEDEQTEEDEDREVFA